MEYVVSPLRSSADPAAVIGFCGALGLRPVQQDESGSSAVFAGGSGRLGVRDSAVAPEAGRTTLHLQVADVRAVAEGHITSPSGLLIGITELTEADDPAVSDQTVAASMDVVAICTVADVQREADFLAGLGFSVVGSGASYLPLTAGPASGVIGLRAASPGSAAPTVALGTETSEPFDALAGRLQADGYAAETVEDESGVWIRVIDPDGEFLEIRPTR